MKLLAIETATEACSVALLCDDELHDRFELAPRRHAELLLPWIDQLLADAGLPKSALDAIAVSRGPGAFTGIRLGIAAAQGIAFALDRPLLPVSSLATLALGAAAAPGSQVLAAIDARMGEIYAGSYRIDADGLPQPVRPEWLITPDRFELAGVDGADWIARGTGLACGAVHLLDRLARRLVQADPEALPRAADLARIGRAMHRRGEGVAADRIEPAYLRDKVAQTLVERGKS